MKVFSVLRLSFGHMLLFVALAVAGVSVALGQNGAVGAPPAASAASDPAIAAQFEETCAGCHGSGGRSGDRAPALANSAKLRAMSDAGIGAIIRNGAGGMPAFSFDDKQLAQYVALIRSWNVVAANTATDAQVAAGEAFFFGKGECADCHMVRGRGGSTGPDLTFVGATSTAEDMGRMLDDPTALMGSRTTASCPGWAFCPDMQWTIVNVRMRDGSTLRGFARNEAEHSIQLQTLDGKLRSIEATEYLDYIRETTSFMPPLKASAEERRDVIAYMTSLKAQQLGSLTRATLPAPTAADKAAVLTPARGEWPSYNGLPSGNRHSALAQITSGNVDRLRLEWMFSPGGVGLETTPVVVDGVMYVTGAKQVCALDARNGRSFWCAGRTARQPTPSGGIAETPRAASANATVLPVGPALAARPSAGVASGNGPNRGVAVVGDRVIFTSDDAYLICINRLTGGVMWTVPLTDPAYGGRYYATPAPLVIGNLVVSGVSGGDSPTRGFLAAFDVTTGKLAWRFWTVPAPGDPAAATWKGPDMATGGAATWMTGSYDKDSNTVFWGVGNPYPSTDGTGRLGDNLYANSVIALDGATGKLRWHYQFTPHDVHDWDATAPMVLVDDVYQGKPRKLLMQANRNGFFYVLDRSNGRFLFAKPFVEKMNWASGIDAKGRPILIPGREPTAEGVFACPAVRGATNWYSTAHNPDTRLFYVMAAEDCGIFRTRGRIYGANVDVKNPGRRYVRALDPETGAIVWEKPLTGSHEANYTGVLSTAGGLLFHGETAGGFAAVDARTGKTLWTVPTNDAWRASPMTYMVGDRQYVAVAAGSNILSFALPAEKQGK